MQRAIHLRWHPFQLNPAMPVEGVIRRDYRIAKFGSARAARPAASRVSATTPGGFVRPGRALFLKSWEYSQQLDARVAESGKQVGIEFRHDRMLLTPNSFRGHVLMVAALQQSLDTQNRVAERSFTGYFTNGEDVGDVEVLGLIARECGVDAMSAPGAFDDPALAAYVGAEEEAARRDSVQGVPLITFEGALVSAGASPEEMLAARLRELIAEWEGDNAR